MTQHIEVKKISMELLFILENMEPIGKFHGLFLEIKTKKGRPTKEQLLWRHKLNDRNYVCEITYGFEETKEVIDRYINNKII